MNSNSALNNVLLALSAQPKANTLPQKGNAEADSAVNFKQAFDDVRAERDVKSKEHCAKKIASTDKRVKAKPDDAVKAENAATPTEKPASQAVEKSTEKDKAENAVVSDDTKKSDVTDTTEATPIVALDVPVPVEPVVESVVSNIATDSVDAVQNIEAPIADKETAALTVDSAVQTPLDGEVVSTPIAGVATEVPQQETMASSVSEVAPDAEDANAAAVVTDVSVKNPAITDVAADAAMADVVATVGTDTLKNAEVKASGLDTETATTSAASDDNASATTTDLKAIFEKMLQAMSAGAGANTNTGENSQGSREQAANPIASLATSMHAPSAFEALARSVDAQSPAARSFVVQTSVPVPVGQPQWSQAVGEKVLWLAAQNVHSAEIRLDPPELGPMQVKITVQQEQTSVNFTSHHAGVREVLDQNLGRLRDMFNEQGLNLVNVDVSDRSFQRHQGEGSEQQGQGNRNSEQDDEETPVAVSSIVQQRLVDHYA